MSERNDKAGLGAAGIYALLLTFPFILYFGFFGLVVLDEKVLGTFWISEVVPESWGPFLQAIYDPLIRLFEL